MRSILFVLSFSLFAQSTLAAEIKLKPIFNSKTTAELTVTENNSTQVQYQLNVEEKNQAYGILVYKDGNCQDFSSPVAVVVNDPKNKDKKIAFNPKGNQFLVYHGPAKKTKLTGTVTAPEKSFFSFEPRGKILVLVAVKNEKSDTGLALACGVFP